MSMLSTIAKRNIRLHIWINFISGLVFLLPVISLLYTYMGLSMAEIVILSNVATLATRILELPTSVLADTTGRKRSLLTAVVCNLLAAIVIFMFPSRWGFVGASLCAALYWSFRSGTGQAFLEENLRIIGEEKKFGKYIGHMMFVEQLAALITPLVAGGLIKRLGTNGYSVLAGLDVIIAGVLVFLTWTLHETNPIDNSQKTRKIVWNDNIATAKQAFINIRSQKSLKLLVIYRSLSNHLTYLPLLILPILVQRGMDDWVGGLVAAGVSIVMMISTKYCYLIGEKRGYARAWIFSSVIQGLFLIIIGLTLNGGWLWIMGLFMVFSMMDGIWEPARNHLLVTQTKGTSIATTRSLIFAIFALYTTIGKQILSYFPLMWALIGLGIFLLIVNILLGKKISAMEE